MREREICDRPRRGVAGLEGKCCGQPERLVAKRGVQRRAQQEGKSRGTANLPKLEARLRESTIVEVKMESSEKKCSKEEGSGQGDPA